MDTRDKILEVAETQFAQKGYAGAHLQRIASEVGVQKTALYYYYPSKAALYLSVLSRMMEDFDRTVSAALEREGAHRERLQRLLDDLNDLLAEKRNYSQILIRIFVDRTGVDLSPLQPVIARTIGTVLGSYREGVEAGAFRKLSSRNVFQSLLGSIVFHYAARDFSGMVLNVEDIFTRSAVAWRRDEVRELLSAGVLVGPDEEGGS
jgi:AcrR family transcriptional regulator